MEHRLTTTVATEQYGNAVRTQTSPVRKALPYHRRRCRLALSLVGLPPNFAYRHFPDRLPLRQYWFAEGSNGYVSSLPAGRWPAGDSAVDGMID